MSDRDGSRVLGMSISTLTSMATWPFHFGTRVLEEAEDWRYW